MFARHARSNCQCRRIENHGLGVRLWICPECGGDRGALPDKARKYTIYELAFSITSEKPPMTPWAEEKFKANKPNVGPNSVSISESNDPILQCFPPGVPRIYLVRGEPVEIAHIPGPRAHAI